LDQLSASAVSIATKVSPQKLKEEANLLEKLRGVFSEQRQAGLSIEERQQLTGEVRVLLATLKNILEQIELEDPNYAAFRRGQPVGFDEIRASLY